MTEEYSQLNENSPLLQSIPKKYGYGLSFQNVIKIVIESVFNLIFLTIFFS